MRVVIFTRFNRVFARDDVTRNKVLESKAWWRERVKVLENTVMRSLHCQTNREFEYVTVFNKEQIERYPHIREFSEKVWGSYIESYNPSTEYEPIELASKSPHDTIFFNVDSDDHIHKDTVKELRNLQVKNGLVPYMDKGYIYDLKTKRMAHYEGNGAPPPFWGIYVPGYMDDMTAIHRYMKDYGMDGHHYQKHKATNSVKLSDGMYLYSVHGKNTTNAWKNPNTAKHVRETIKAKKKILTNFGYVERKKDN